MKAPDGESFLDPRSVYCIFSRRLSVEALNENLRQRFMQLTDSRDPKRIVIPLVDAVMSGVAMFTLKIPSMLALDSYRSSTIHAKNLSSLFGIQKMPSDTSMREILDEVNPDELRVGFKDVFHELQRGKALEQYTFIDGRYLLALDGTGYFSSPKVHCPSCMEKKQKDGTVSYYHQMVAGVLIHPDIKSVIPLCPEPIIKQDGESKNDCERNASARILKKIKEDHPRLKLIITEDGLSSNAPHIRDLKSHGMSFILGAKPGDHKFLFEEFSLAGSRTKEVVIRDEKSVQYLRFVNGLQLNQSNEDVIINFLEYTQCMPGKKNLTFTWVTDIEITEKNAYQIMRGGRARWKIENETFNTLKNQGYEFEHNYGHGHKNLSVNLAFLMMLAFLVDQSQLLTSKVVQLALQKNRSLSEFYRMIRSLFDVFLFENWLELYEALAYGFDSKITIKRRSNSS
jgi:hypothetical protein